MTLGFIMRLPAQGHSLVWALLSFLALGMLLGHSVEAALEAEHESHCFICSVGALPAIDRPATESSGFSSFYEAPFFQVSPTSLFRSSFQSRAPPTIKDML